ncbi:GcrA family cell cycle regulator [Sphingomonas sp. SRS2]|uniref:GcrA family cell cycle regulator n=1 Tax=Sphingomonas sp. SRS2 TaxID=133190 RepID=UPI0006183F67|nr:GcrA family cell cycle regulator [Sphingomonas sp. SRS2]KKC27945.1 GcrA cell cycle regulator [Sphingomonas sp. SRS2]
MSWTDERIDQLKRLWGQGMTASQIAEDLGGVSRNAVIGKAHRLGLEARPSPVKGGDSSASASAPAAPAAAAAAAPPPPERAAAPAPRPAPVPAPAPAAAAAPAEKPAAPQPMVRSIGPGGFQRQTPGEQTAPITPAPPRRLVPAKPSAEMANKTSLLDLNDKICKWPLGHPGEPDFHFCGEQINPGFPYCLSHCSVAYQAQLPRRDRRPPPPLPFGGPRVR